MHTSRIIKGSAAALLASWFSLFPIAAPIGQAQLPKRDIRIESPLENRISEFYRKHRKEIDFWIYDVFHLPSDKAIFFDMKTMEKVPYKGQMVVPNFSDDKTQREKARAYFRKQGIQGVYFVAGRKKEVTECLENTGSLYFWLHNQFTDDGRSLYGTQKVPPEFFWLFLHESLGNPKTISYAGAHGMWQFMLSTGSRYGLSRTWDVDGRHDPVESTKAAYAYLDDLLAMFHDWRLALLGYLTGEVNLSRFLEESLSDSIYGQRVNAAIKARGSYGKHLEVELKDALLKKDREIATFFQHHNISRPDYDLIYDLAKAYFKEKGYHSLDQYVNMFVAFYLCCNYPSSFGFEDIKYRPPVTYAELNVKPGIQLSKLAKELDVPEELKPEFLFLNSHLTRNLTSAKAPVRVPVAR